MVITCLTALHEPFRRAILGSPGFFKRQALHGDSISLTSIAYIFEDYPILKGVQTLPLGAKAIHK